MIELTGTATAGDMRINTGRCPYCESTDVDWGFDSDSSVLTEINTAICQDCNKMWKMIYVFSEWRPIDD